VTAFRVLPGLKVSFGDQLIRVYDGTAVNTGYYTFTYVKDGETKIFPARYSFTYVKNRRELAHCRPPFLGHATGAEVAPSRAVDHGGYQRAFFKGQHQCAIDPIAVSFSAVASAATNRLLLRSPCIGANFSRASRLSDWPEPD